MLWRMSNQTFVTYFEDLSQYLPSKTEKNHKRIGKGGRERRKASKRKRWEGRKEEIKD
jgi:hypothetical protein